MKGGGKKHDPVASFNETAVVDDVAKLKGWELMVLRGELLEPYEILTRAQSAILMGKHSGIKYDCTDTTAFYQIATKINARKSS